MSAPHQVDVLPECPTANVRFEYLDGLAITIRPAFPDVNPLFDAAAQAWLGPVKLSAQLPEGHRRKLTEAQAFELLVKVYACGVIAGCPTDEVMDQWSAPEWEDWLRAHPDELHSLRDGAENRQVFGLAPLEALG